MERDADRPRLPDSPADEVARAELVANAGHEFDPRIVTAFLRIVDRTGDQRAPTASITETTTASADLQHR